MTYRTHTSTHGEPERTWVYNAPATVRDLWSFDVQIRHTPATAPGGVLAIWRWVCAHALTVDAKPVTDQTIDTMTGDDLAAVAVAIYESGLGQDHIADAGRYLAMVELADLYDWDAPDPDSLSCCECPKCLRIESDAEVPCRRDEHDPGVRGFADFYRLALEDPQWFAAAPEAYVLAIALFDAKAMGSATRRQIKAARDEKDAAESAEWDRAVESGARH